METREQLEALLEHTQDIVVVLDTDGAIQYENAAVERTLGYAPGELLGVNPFDLFHPDDQPVAARAFDEVLDGGPGTTRQVEHRVQTAVGDWVWLESILSNRLESPLSGLVISAWDVTNRKHVEREREQTHEGLLELTEKTNDVLWMFTADWNELLFVNSAYEDIYGRPIDALEVSWRTEGGGLEDRRGNGVTHGAGDISRVGPVR